MACSEWKVPCAPVKPWQMTLVFLSTRRTSAGLLHGFDNFLGRVAQIVSRRDGKTDCRQNFLPLSTLVPSRRTTRRHGNIDFFGRSDDAFGDHVTAHDTAEDIDQNAFDVGITKNDLEGFGNAFFGAPPPTSKEVGRSLPYSLMMSMVAMARPAPLTMQPM